MKKYVSLCLAIIFFFTTMGNQSVYAQNDVVIGQEQAAESNDLNREANENPGANPEDEDNQENTEDKEDDKDDDAPNPGPGDTEEKPDLKTEAAVSDFTLEYKPIDDTMILKYQVNEITSGVDILVDGHPVETGYSKIYTSYIHDLPEEAEGKTYAFQVVPYELRTVEGKTVKIMGTP